MANKILKHIIVLNIGRYVNNYEWQHEKRLISKRLL